MPLNRATKRPQSEADVKAIWDYVAYHSPREADALLVEIEAKFNFLANTPFAGRARPDLAENIRSFPSGRYMIFYVIVLTGIEVVRVLHGRQDVRPDDFA